LKQRKSKREKEGHNYVFLKKEKKKEEES